MTPFRAGLLLLAAIAITTSLNAAPNCSTNSLEPMRGNDLGIQIAKCFDQQLITLTISRTGWESLMPETIYSTKITKAGKTSYYFSDATIQFTKNGASSGKYSVRLKENCTIAAKTQGQNVTLSMQTCHSLYQ